MFQVCYQTQPDIKAVTYAKGAPIRSPFFIGQT